MKFLLDQDVYASTLRFLRDLGHDVIPVAEIGLAQAEDAYLLKQAQEQNRIFVTRDRDFGSLVFISGLGAGVIYLRLLPSTFTDFNLLAVRFAASSPLLLNPYSLLLTFSPGQMATK